MKKVTLITIVILALLVSMLPVSTVLAGKGVINTEITLNNRTKGVVVVTMINSKGQRLFYSFDPGYVYHQAVPQGVYEYYIVTRCKNEVGRWNLTRNKAIDLYCPSEGLDVQLLPPTHAHVVPAN
ncbi:MAG: hypothetical protein WCK35_13760 [Chloroflexota bacterium]